MLTRTPLLRWCHSPWHGNGLDDHFCRGSTLSDTMKPRTSGLRSRARTIPPCRQRSSPTSLRLTPRCSRSRRSTKVSFEACAIRLLHYRRFFSTTTVVSYCGARCTSRLMTLSCSCHGPLTTGLTTGFAVFFCAVPTCAQSCIARPEVTEPHGTTDPDH